MIVGAPAALARSTLNGSPGASVSPDLPPGPINPNTRAALPLTSRLRVVAVSDSGADAAFAERNNCVPAAAAAMLVVSNRRREMGVSMDQLPASFAALPAILAVAAVDGEPSVDQKVNKLEMPSTAAYCANSCTFCGGEMKVPCHAAWPGSGSLDGSRKGLFSCPKTTTIGSSFGRPWRSHFG